MTLKKRLSTLSLSAIILLSSMGYAFADSSKVVTLGTNLSDTQKQQVLKYLGVEENEAVIIEVNNQDERKYLEGVIPDAQIGTKTYSCAYVEPTNSGKINVKTVNLSYVNSNMLSSAFNTATSGQSANIVAISPFITSGTGALTGILLATEDATGKPLDEDKKELATEEMIVTGDLADQIGGDGAQDKATGIVNDIKTEIIKNNTKDTVQIAQTIENVVNNYNVTLNVNQTQQLEELMQKIAEHDYDYKQMKDTLNNIAKDIDNKLEAIGENVKKGFFDGVKDFFGGIGDWFSGIFEKEEDLGILETTNDELLGENANIDATTEEAINLPSSEEVKGFFAKLWEGITNFFSNLFNKAEQVETTTPEVEEPLFNDTEADFEIKQEEESQTDVESNNATESTTNTSSEENTEKVEQPQEETSNEVVEETENIEQ